MPTSMRLTIGIDPSPVTFCVGRSLAVHLLGRGRMGKTQAILLDIDLQEGAELEHTANKRA